MAGAAAHPRGGGLHAQLLKPGRAVAGRPRRPARGPLRSSAPGHGDSETLELTRAAMHCRVALARLKLTWARRRRAAHPRGGGALSARGPSGARQRLRRAGSPPRLGATPAAAGPPLGAAPADSDVWLCQSARRIHGLTHH